MFFLFIVYYNACIYHGFWDTSTFWWNQYLFAFLSKTDHFFTSLQAQLLGPIYLLKKKAAGHCSLLCCIWRLARSSACIMYLALLLCQSHVNLCAVSIQEPDARKAVIHSTSIMLCIIFSFKTLSHLSRNYFLKSI